MSPQPRVPARSRNSSRAEPVATLESGVPAWDVPCVEPALTLAILSAGVLGVSLVVDLTSSACVALSRLGSMHRWSVAPRLARVAAAVFVMSALLRMGHVGAVTPPPMHRIEHVDRASGEPLAGELPVASTEKARTLPTTASSHVVANGECLWRIARSHLDAHGLPSTGSDVGRMWRAIYAQNRDLIGDDPDLILPGQILTIPGDADGT